MIIRSSILVALVSLACSVSQAQWIQTNGPLRCSALTFCSFGNVILTGTTDGVFRSSDQGSSWQRCSNGLPDNPNSVYAIVALNGKLYSVIDSDVYRSDDTGSTWHRTSSAPSFRTFGQLATSDSAIYYFGKDFYRSESAGVSWIRPDSSLSKLAKPATGLSVGSTIYAAGAWIIKSTNEGRTWDIVAVPPADTNWAIISMCNIGDALFFANQQLDILRRLGPNMPVERAGLQLGILENGRTLLTSSGSILVAVNGSRVFRSVDSARSWQKISVILPVATEIQSLAFHGTELLASYNHCGLFRSIDSGMHWSSSSGGLYVSDPTVMATTGNTIAVGTKYGLFISADRGNYWQSQTLGIPDNKIGSLLFDRRAWYAGGSTLQLSYDFGATWIRANQRPNLNYVHAIARSGNNIIVGGHPDTLANGFALSTDDGISWTSSRVTSGKSGGIETYCFSIASNFALAATSDGVYRSADKGDSWRDSNKGLDDQNPPIVNTIGQVGSNCILSKVGPDSTVKGEIFVSRDAGFSWSRAQDTTVPSRGIVTAFVTVDSSLFVATDSSGIFLTTDAGGHWTSVSAGLRDSIVTALAVLGSDLVACTGTSGVWRRPLGEMLVHASVQSNSSIPISAYPNPSTHSIHVNWPFTDNEITVRLFDEKGSSVWSRKATVSGGSVLLEFDGIAAGAYKLELQSPRNSQSTPIVIQR